jgi:hypothetical protein
MVYLPLLLFHLRFIYISFHFTCSTYLILQEVVLPSLVVQAGRQARCGAGRHGDEPSPAVHAEQLRAAARHPVHDTFRAKPVHQTKN